MVLAADRRVVRVEFDASYPADEDEKPDMLAVSRDEEAFIVLAAESGLDIPRRTDAPRPRPRQQAPRQRQACRRMKGIHGLA